MTNTLVPSGSTVAFGASTTWGWGGGSGGYSAAEGGYEGDGYPRQLAAMNNWVVPNYGIVGDALTAPTTHDPVNARQRFQDFIATNYDIHGIVAWIGTNDLSTGATATQIVNAYRAMIGSATAVAAPLFLCTIQPQGWGSTDQKEIYREQVNNWIRQGHADAGVYYAIDVEQALKGSNSRVMDSRFIANGISANPQTGYPHLSVPGYGVVAQSVTSGMASPVNSLPLVTY